LGLRYRCPRKLGGDFQYHGMLTVEILGVCVCVSQEQFEFALTAVAQEVQAILHAPPAQP